LIDCVELNKIENTMRLGIPNFFIGLNQLMRLLMEESSYQSGLEA
jgi:hypothetical protein